MKKLTAIIFTLGLILTLSACDLDDVVENKNPNNGISSTTDGSSENIISQDGLMSDTSSGASSTQITRDRAIEIALNHAGFKQSDVINLSADYDRELNGDEWEIEFDKDGYEYSYDIDAASGKIINNTKEIDN